MNLLESALGALRVTDTGFMPIAIVQNDTYITKENFLEIVSHGEEALSRAVHRIRICDYKIVAATIATLGLLRPLEALFSGRFPFTIDEPLDDERNTLLHLLSRNGYVEGVEFVLGHGADYLKCNSSGEIALHEALKSGKEKVIRAFLEKDRLLINRSFAGGKTLLCFAAIFGHIEVCKELLANNALDSITDEYGKAPIHYAIENGHRQLFFLFAENRQSVHFLTKKKWSTLHFAAKVGDLVICQALMGYDLSPNQYNDEAITPFHLAILTGREELITYFLRNKVDLKIAYRHFIPVIQLLYLYKDIVDMEQNSLEECGAFEELVPQVMPNTVSQGNFSVDEAILFCLKNGATIDDRNASGVTLMHHACQKRDRQMVRFCLQHGADVRSGKTLFQITAASGDCEIATMLLEHNAPIDFALHVAVDALQSDMVVFLLRVVDVNLQDEEQKSVLHLFCEKERPEASSVSILEKLLDAGVSFYHTDKTGKTALHSLHPRLHSTILKLLFERAPTLSLSDGYGNTPLHCVSMQANLEQMQLFFQAGADPQIRNYIGLKALEAVPMDKNGCLAVLFKDFGFFRKIFIESQDNDLYKDGLFLAGSFATRLLAASVGMSLLATPVAACEPSASSVMAGLFKVARSWNTAQSNLDERYYRQQQFEQLLGQLRASPELLINDSENSETANFLEVAYLLGDPSLMQKLRERLGSAQFTLQRAQLQEKYPRMQQVIFDECAFHPTNWHIKERGDNATLRGRLLMCLSKLRKEIIGQIAESLVHTLLFQAVYSDSFLSQLKNRIFLKIIEVIGDKVGVTAPETMRSGYIDSAHKKILDFCAPEANPQENAALFISQFWVLYSANSIMNCLVSFIKEEIQNVELRDDERVEEDRQFLAACVDRATIRQQICEKFKIIEIN